MKSPLDFFSWAFENKPAEQQIIVCVANKYEKDGKSYPFFSAYNCDTPENASKLAVKYCSLKKDVYYTLTTYTENIQPVENGKRVKVSRQAKFAKMSRLIGFDVDCGDDKPYPTWEDAIKVTVPILMELGLTEKEYTLVKSGGGLHGYIRLNEFISKEKWIKITTALKAFLLSTELQIDKSKLTDPAMLLRPVGTLNFKKAEPRAVETLYFGGQDIPLDRLQDLLKNFLPSSHIEKEIDFDGIQDIDNFSLKENSDEGFKPNYLDVQAKCNQINLLSKDCNVSEKLWYAALGVASATSEPDEAAIAWSKNCETYRETDTLNKMHQWKKSTTGPATCTHIYDLNPEGCKGCPFFQKIKTPIQSVTAPVRLVEGENEDFFEIPPGYKIVGSALFKYNEELEFPISDYLVYLESVARLYDVRRPVTYLRLKIKLPRTGWTALELELNTLTGSSGKAGESFGGIMGGIGVALHKKAMGWLQDYVLDCYRHYQNQRDTGKVCTQMGWTPEGNFIYGLKEYKGVHETPEFVTPQGGTLQVLAKGMEPAGRRADWLAGIEVLANPGLELHAFGYLLAYGSPLFNFTGLDGCTINFYSEESGSGKTTAPRIAMSTFGSPKILGGGKADSDAHLFAKLGGLNNIPAYADEMTESLPHRISELLYAVSEGQGKGRADRYGEMRESKRWSLLFMMSSNKSMYEKLDAHTRSSSGQKARLIELNMDKNAIMEKYGETLNLLIEDNYGHGAIDYINHIVTLHKKGMLAMDVRMALRDFSDHFNFTFEGEERFIRSVVGCTWYGAKIAVTLGLCPKFDLDKIFNAVLMNIKRNRLKLKEAIEDSESVINSMLARYPDNWVKIMHEGKKPPSGNAPRGRCLGRIEVHYAEDYHAIIPTHGTISIGVLEFEAFCRETNRPYHKYVEEFRGNKFRNFSEKYLTITSGIKYNVDGQLATPIRLKCFTMDIPITSLECLQKVNIVNKDIEFNYGANAE